MNDDLKRRVAEAAAAQVEDGMVVGLGTGSTAALMIEALGRRVAAGLRVVGIPTSEHSGAQARGLGIPLVDFDTHPQIDLTIDGADEVDTATLNLIKGLGGALLREKIVASASRRMTVIVDGSKLVTSLGGVRLPVEVVTFGWQATAVQLRRAGADPVLRMADGQPFRTDSGNLILDCAFAAIGDAGVLNTRLKMITGVVETGLFIGLATTVIAATADGLQTLERT